MKRKTFLVGVLVCAFCLTLCACGNLQKDAVGTWIGEYEYEGNRYTATFTLCEGGSYSKTLYRNGALRSTEFGTWEVDGGDVVLHKDGDRSGSTRYDYDGTALINNGHRHYRK